MREKERIPSSDNYDYTLVVNYLLIIIPNHSNCMFGTIFYTNNDTKDSWKGCEGKTLHALLYVHIRNLLLAAFLLFLVTLPDLTCYIV